MRATSRPAPSEGHCRCLVLLGWGAQLCRQLLGDGAGICPWQTLSLGLSATPEGLLPPWAKLVRGVMSKTSPAWGCAKGIRV